MGVSKNNDTPKWMVKIRENPMSKWMIWGVNTHPYFLEIPISLPGHGTFELMKIVQTSQNGIWILLPPCGRGHIYIYNWKFTIRKIAEITGYAKKKNLYKLLFMISFGSDFSLYIYIFKKKKICIFSHEFSHLPFPSAKAGNAPVVSLVSLVSSYNLRLPN